MQTMQDLIEAIKPILPNALIIDTDDGIMIETNLELGIGGLLQPMETGGEQVSKCEVCNQRPIIYWGKWCCECVEIMSKQQKKEREQASESK
jgi:hypothetical protein